MAGQHGGPRPGAGRKSNADIDRARTLIAEAVTDDDWRDIFKLLAIKAAQGDTRAAELLMKYQFGLPTQPLDVEQVSETWLTLDI